MGQGPGPPRRPPQLHVGRPDRKPDLRHDRPDRGRTPGPHQGGHSNVPLGRFGTADEVTSVIRFLISEQASYITGADYAVDGGFRL
ncbi:SDR family oxidoreductase [Streptomyces coelicoflavus]|uniref:SDR family oxidoreductase n=1 Tax=Streptomyces coelicoflavus TaxID=285562 RepID=UPI003D1566A2